LPSPSRPRGNWFEPVILIPSNPYAAAAMLFAVAAYPNRGEGLPGGKGARFAEALCQLVAREAKRRGHPNFADCDVPTLRQLNGIVGPGLRRVKRRLAVVQIARARRDGPQFTWGLSPKGDIRSARARTDRRSNGKSPSFRGFVLSHPNLRRWAMGVSLQPATSAGRARIKSSNEDQIADMVKQIRFSYHESAPVLNISSAIYSQIVLVIHDQRLRGAGQVGYLLSLFYRAPAWIDDALAQIQQLQLNERHGKDDVVWVERREVPPVS